MIDITGNSSSDAHFAIVGPRFGAVLLSACHDFHCHCHCHCQIVFRLLLLWISGCTWREGRHGDKDVDRERVNIVVVDVELLRSETNN